MILENSPWKYTEYDMMFFVDDEVEKRNDELVKLFKENKEEFDKKLRGIVIGAWLFAMHLGIRERLRKTEES